ncbi:hypothetical protein ACIBKZ_15665 [Streptomyces sp. NPDC050421]|uniref:hypothetical protein n=1 Tax=Streptomyces sp. NPDC050421 TaxID=3365613 RepID=UPI0037A5611D
MKTLRFVAWVVLWLLGALVGWFVGFGLSIWLMILAAPAWMVDNADTFLTGFGAVLAVLLARGVSRDE